MRVDFMIIGAQKCGTTTLAEQLSEHPSVCFCATKEPGYFHRTPDWEAHLDTYHALYQPTPGQLCGEGSTMYTFLPEWQDTHLRLHRYNPDLKLIYLMRNPVERVISNYAHRLVRKTVHETPESVIFAHPIYINRSRYGVQLRPYLELFGRAQILPLIFEEYIADQPQTLQRVADFLGIDPAAFQRPSEADKATHRSVGEYQLGPIMQKVREWGGIDSLLAYVPAPVRQRARQSFGQQLTEKPTIAPATRQLLWRFLEDDVHFVEALLGRQLPVWRQGFEE